MLMNLTVEEIKKITFGAVRIEEHNGELHFFKCTNKQCDVWHNESEALGERSEFTVGITLDFVTDADEAVFEVCGNKFELLINSNFSKQYVFSDKDFHKINISLNGDKNRVTLVFPSHDRGILKSVELRGESFIKPHKFERKILFLGDSITQGWNSKYDVMSYAYQVADFFNAERIINGIGGAYYLPESFDLIDFDPDTVVVAYGTNDPARYTTINAFKAAVADFLKKVKETYGEKKLIVVTPIFCFEDLTSAGGTLQDYKDAIEKIAHELLFKVVDGYDLVPHDKDFYADTVHPNDLGFGIYARKLIFELGRM